MQQSPVLAEPSFVGRETELKDLQNLLESMPSGKGSTVFVSGVAGSGKTRLTNELINLAKKKGFAVFVGWSLSRSNVPYFPFIEAFSFNSVDQENSSSNSITNVALKTASYLTEPYPMTTNADEHVFPLVWKDRAFLGVTKELLFMSTVKPLLLVLEDLHWADTASLALLHYISRAMATERIMIVGTFRSEELSGEEMPHPLMETLHLMGREALFKEIKLSNLNKANIGQIAESMLNGPVDAALIQSLSDESRGNPLFVVESIRMLAESGNLVKEHNGWRVKTDRIGIPYVAKEVILRRIEALKPEQRRTLDVAAVIGDRFDANLIGSVLSIDSLIVLETLNKIFHSTSLVRVEDNLYTFDHAMSREVLYQEISAPLKIGYHEKIAEQMESKRDQKNFSASQVAFHFIKSGNKPKAIEYSLIAGRAALATYSNLEANRHFTWILQTISDTQDDLETRRKALEGLGDAFYANNAFKDAITTYESLAEISNGPVRQRALVKAMYAAFFQGDYQCIDQLVKRAEAESDLGPLERARILHYKAAIASGLRNQLLEGIKLSEESLSIFEEEYALPDVAWLSFVVADFASGQGEMEKAIAYCLRSLAIYDRLGDLRSMMEAFNEAGKVFFYCGLYSEAHKMFESVFAIEQRTKMGNYIMLAKASCFLSMVYEMTGDLKRAIEKNLAALEYSEKANSPRFLVMIYSNMVKQYAIQGELSKAIEYDAKLNSMYRPAQAATDLTTRTYYSLAQTVLLSGKNQFKQSIEQFEKYLPFFRANFPNPNLLNIPLTYYAWVLEKSGQTRTAEEIREEIRKTIFEYSQKLTNANIQALFIIPTKVTIGDTFEGRLDIVNVSRAHCSIEMQSVLPSELMVIEHSPEMKLNQGTLSLPKTQLEPFSVKTIILKLQAKRTGQFALTSSIKYNDRYGKTKTYEPKPVIITVQPSKKERPLELSTIEPIEETKLTNQQTGLLKKEDFQFSSEVAEKIFNFLIKEFIKDYMLHRLVAEKAGWRSFVEIAAGEKIPKSSLYGFRNHKGRALVELERRGLVEARFFPGERGRGGRITRLRVSYEKEIIKSHIDSLIRKKNE